VDALIYYFRERQDIVIWFDLFSINLHTQIHLDSEWLYTTFVDAVKGIGYTVLVMASWNNTLCFSRGWCIFELFCTSITDSNFEIAMSKSAQKVYFNAMRNSPQAEFNKLSSNVNFKHSLCSKSGDKGVIIDAILQLIGSEKILSSEFEHPTICNIVGFGKINSVVSNLICRWVIDDIKEISDQCTDVLDRLSFYRSVGIFHTQLGSYDIAKLVFVDAISSCKSTLDKSMGTIASTTVVIDREVRLKLKNDVEDLYIKLSLHLADIFKIEGETELLRSTTERLLLLVKNNYSYDEFFRSL